MAAKTGSRTFDRANPCPPTNTAALAAFAGRLFVPLLGGNRATRCSSGAIRQHYELEGEAEADIVVAVRRLVVVAISRAAVLSIVVPAAAAIHAVLALYAIGPFKRKSTFFRSIAASACWVNAINGSACCWQAFSVQSPLW